MRRRLPPQVCSPGERRRRGGDAGSEGDRLRAPYLGHWPFCRGAQLQERDNVVRAGPLAKRKPQSKASPGRQRRGEGGFFSLPFSQKAPGELKRTNAGRTVLHVKYLHKVFTKVESYPRYFLILSFFYMPP